MKKHIIGLALSSFIVGAAAIVYSMFNAPQVVEVPAPNYPQTYSSKTSCWKMKRESSEGNDASPFVTQAVFNVKTKKLSWECDLSKTGNLSFLHFWVKDERGIHLIDSIPAKNCSRGETVIKSFQQFLESNKLSPQANLYLIPDTTVYPYPDETDCRMKFEIEKAIPVTVDYGK